MVWQTDHYSAFSYRNGDVQNQAAPDHYALYELPQKNPPKDDFQQLHTSESS